jgi:hypothetical protein
MSCDNWVAVGASGVVQRLFRAGSKPMCPSAPMHKAIPAVPSGMSRHTATQRAIRDDRSPFIGSTRAEAAENNALQERYRGCRAW